MNALEWNPAFGPITSTIIALGAGAVVAFLFRRTAERRGRRQAWLVFAPKAVLIGLLLLALFDPTWKSTHGSATPVNVIVLQDISASMDLRDDGSSSRTDRAERAIRAIEADAPSQVHFQVIPFDTHLHEPGYRPKPGAERGTDLAGALLALQQRGSIAGANGLIVVTDGGDEAVNIPKPPAVPFVAVGVGAPVDSWHDIGIGTVNSPASIEEGGEFDLEAELYARPGSVDRAKERLGALRATLEEWRDNRWNEAQSKTVNLLAQRAVVSFHIKASGAGAHRYRVRIPELFGEVTFANNARVVGVEVRRRSLHVLYFTQELGADYKHLRAELGADPGITFTALYRVLEDRFTVQGDRTGFEDLEHGLPVDAAVLKRYDCLILGSFPANLLTDAQQRALVAYVEGGGALVLLGGDTSFGRGGYAQSPLAPLIPWTVARDEPALVTGGFPVVLAPGGAAVGFMEGLREALATAGGATLDSVNLPGALRPGAIGLLNATVDNRVQPVVALQRFGKGQVLGIATNTLWRWAAAGQDLKTIYARFWRQTVRGLTQKLEGGSLLGIRWDRDHYRPGEEAVVEVRVQGSSEAGAVRLVGALKGPEGDAEVAVAPMPGMAGVYTVKFSLARRGEHTFSLTAYAGMQTVETYQRTFPVEPLVEEGANPELKDAYLRDIALRARGLYVTEKDVEPVKAFLQDQMVARTSSVSMPLVEMGKVFPLLVLLLLLVEWLIRRRLNLL